MNLPEPEMAKPGYETQDMGIRGVAAVLGGFAVVVALAVTGIGAGLHALSRRDSAAQRPITREQQAVLVVPGPHLQAGPKGDLGAVQAHENALLASYAWIDPARSKARIPIARAMALVVGRPLDPAGRSVAPR